MENSCNFQWFQRQHLGHCLLTKGGYVWMIVVAQGEHHHVARERSPISLGMVTDCRIDFEGKPSTSGRSLRDRGRKRWQEDAENDWWCMEAQPGTHTERFRTHSPLHAYQPHYRLWYENRCSQFSLSPGNCLELYCLDRSVWTGSDCMFNTLNTLNIVMLWFAHYVLKILGVLMRNG